MTVWHSSELFVCLQTCKYLPRRCKTHTRTHLASEWSERNNLFVPFEAMTLSRGVRWRTSLSADIQIQTNFLTFFAGEIWHSVHISRNCHLPMSVYTRRIKTFNTSIWWDRRKYQRRQRNKKSSHVWLRLKRQPEHTRARNEHISQLSHNHSGVNLFTADTTHHIWDIFRTQENVTKRRMAREEE